MLLNYNDYVLETEYLEFERYLDLMENGKIEEGFNLSKMFGGAWETITELANTLKIGIGKVIGFFKNKYVFGIFKTIGFSISKLYELIKQGYETFTGFRDKLAKYIASNPIVQNVSGYAKWLDEFLDKNPILKKLSGAVLAYMLFYIWMNAISFTGDPEFDFNISDMYYALVGKKGFFDIFGGENGVKTLVFILTNKLTGLSFPWVGSSSVQFLFAIIYTISVALGQKIKWKKQVDLE